MEQFGFTLIFFFTVKFLLYLGSEYVLKHIAHLGFTVKHSTDYEA